MVTKSFILHNLMTLVFCTVVIPGRFLKAYPRDKDCSLCSSKDCLSRAQSIRKNLKLDVDPCEDFFAFACGGYMENIGKNITRSTYDDNYLSLQVLIKDLLENLHPKEGTASEKIKIVYDTCVNKGASELRAIPVAIDFLHQVGIPNWPNLESNFQFADLSETLGKLAVHGEFSFIMFQPSPYAENFHSFSPPMVLPGYYLLNSKIKPKDVENSVRRILSYFKINESEAESMWKNFIAVEDIGMQLQNEEAGHALGCKSGHLQSFAIVNCSHVPHKVDFLCDLWKTAMKNGDLGKYYREDIMHISCRWNHFYYIENIFSNLLNKVNHKILADYLALRFFISHLDDMNLYLHLTKKTYPEGNNSPTKTPEPVTRWEYCIQWITKSMYFILGYEYTQKVLTEPMQEDVLSMIQNYVQSLSSIIESQKSMSKQVKLFLRKQLTKLEIGFKKTMERFRNETFASIYYKEFHPVKESFLRNMLEYGKFSVIGKENILFNSFQSSSDPYTMDFGLALLLPPTYSYGLLKILKYATLGSIIGHELSHNLQFYLDLEDEGVASLKETMQCFVNKYSELIIERTGKAITSNDAREEVIAENIGWELTEKILEEIDSSNNLRLPGLDYTAKQLQYISFAQDSCASLSKDVENEYYSSKPHSLPKLRVFNTLQNSKIFTEAFNCSASSFMNPVNKCAFFDD